MTHRALEWLVHPRLRKHQVLGMDIGTDAVRLALVEREGRKAVVRWVHEESLTALQGFADYDSVAPLLESVLSGRFDRRIDVATVPPWSSARVTVQEFPAMDDARFAKAATWHFQRNPVDDMVRPLHHAIPQAQRNNPEGHEVMDGVMISMDQVMVEGLEELCSGLRLRLKSLLPRALCFVPLVVEQFGTSHSLVNVDIGAGQTRLTFIVDGSVRLVRRIKPCANDVVRHICDSDGLSWEDANLALMAHSGVGPLAEDDPEGILARSQASTERFLDRLATQLTGEIERSIAYVEARHATPISQISLSGGLAGSPYLLAELSQGLSHEVVLLDPHDLSAADLEVSPGTRAHFSLAIGAATEALMGDGRRNILHSRHHSGSEGGTMPSTAGMAPRLRMAAIALGAGLVLGLGAHDLYRARHLHELVVAQERADHRLYRLSAEADSLGNQRDLFDLADRIEALRDLYDQRRLYTPFLDQVVRSLPEEVWLTQLSVREVPCEGKPAEEGPETFGSPTPDPVHRIRIAGRSDAVDEIGRAVLQLEQAQILDRIEVLNITEVESDRTNVARFQFEIEGIPRIPRRPERTDEVVEVAR